MKDALAIANYFVPAAHAAENSPDGTASEREILRTWSPEEEAAMSRITCSGNAANVTPSITPAHNSRLSEEQQKFLVRMKRAREQDFMLSMHDCDILIQIIEELTR